jgi:hypothetical protein
VPAPRGPCQALAQGLLNHQELHQRHHQAKNGGSTQEGSPPDNDDGAGTMYPGEDGVVHMIFSGSLARPSRQCEKLIRREVFNVDTTKSSYLKWSEIPITFDRKDHPDHVP